MLPSDSLMASPLHPVHAASICCHIPIRAYERLPQGLTTCPAAHFVTSDITPFLSHTFRCRYGRRRMQVVGFLALVLLFGTCGVAFPTLTASSRGLMTFQALYFLSSFFNQVKAVGAKVANPGWGLRAQGPVLGCITVQCSTVLMYTVSWVTQDRSV